MLPSITPAAWAALGDWADGAAQDGRLPLIAAIAALILIPMLTLAYLLAAQSAKQKGTTITIPRRYPFVPGVIHVAGLWLIGPHYLTRMVSNPHSPICVFKVLGRRVVIAHGGLENEFAKYSKQINLTRFAASTLAQYIFAFPGPARDAVMAMDTRPMFQRAFVRPDSLSELADATHAYIEDAITNLRESQVQMSRWLFRFTVRAVAHSLYDKDSPWVASESTMDDMMTFGESFYTLYLPFPHVTASKAYEARRNLLQALMAHRKKRKAEAETTVTHRFNMIQFIDDNWENNPSYYGIEILSALALLTTIGNVVTFLIRHLLSDSTLFEKIQKETEALQSEDGVIDMCNIFESCPLLVASWYEVLRVHATLVPRQAVEGFELAGKWSVAAGDIILLPMTASNLDPALWGDDCSEFVPSRHLNADGSVNLRQTRKVKGFGVAGNLCPGRYHGFATAMAVVVSLIGHVDMRSKSGAWPAPRPARGFTAGMERFGDDVLATISKKSGGRNGRNFKIINSGSVARY